MVAINDQVNHFGWSLKPLVVCLKFVGIPTNFSNANKSSTKFVLIFLVIVIANVVINCPRGVDARQLDFMKEVLNFDSPFLYFRANPQGLILLVTAIAEIIFFCYVPVIHVAFLLTVLFDPNWKKIVGLLEKIQLEMKLSEEFHKKCRLQCNFALVQLFLVKDIYICANRKEICNLFSCF